MASDLRIGGLASGIDTEAMIKKMLAGENRKIDKKYQQKQVLEWRRNDYRDVNTKLLAVRSAIFDLKLASAFEAKTVSSSDTSILTATATGQAEPGSYTVKVKQLAQKVSMSSQSAISSNADKSSIAAQFGIPADAKINFTLAGVDEKGNAKELPLSFTAGTTKMSDLVKIINDEKMGITASYDQTLDRVFLNTTAAGSQGKIKIKMDGILDSAGNVLKDASGKCLSFFGNYLKMNVNGSTLNEIAPANGVSMQSERALVIHDDKNIKLTDMYAAGTAPAAINFTVKGPTGTKSFTFSDLNISLETMLTQINNEALKTGVTATYASDTGQVMLTSPGQITISGDTQNFLRDKLNMTIGTAQGTLYSNSSVRTYDASKIKLNALYTCPTDLKFTLEGGLGSHLFSFSATAISNVTVQDMIERINDQQSVTGITAHYDGATGKLAFTDSAPIAALASGSTATTASLSFNEALYSSSDGTSKGVLTKLTEGQDLTSRFALTGTGTLTSATYHIDPATGKGRVDFVMAGAANGDSISIKPGIDSVFDAAANQYQALPVTYNAAAASWSYTSRANTDRMVAVRYDNEGFLGDELNMGMFTQEGQKAIIDFNDAQNLEFDSNQITILGSVNLNLQNADPAKTIGITVKNDAEAALKKIKAFVEAYNTAIVYMNTELNETNYNNPNRKYGGGGQYLPLSAAQKKDMKEEDIKIWEAKAKSGMLRGDAFVFTAYSETRRAAMDPVAVTNGTQAGLAKDNQYTSLSSIGITTLKYVQNSLEGGKLYIDETKLKAALEADSDKVAELFTIDKGANGTKGVAIRLYDAVNANMESITNKAGSSSASIDRSEISQEISRVNKNITTLETRVKDLSDRYWKQFSAMEQMMARYNSQTAWLSQQTATISGAQ